MNKYLPFSVKWRPKFFFDVIGHDNIINLIINSFKLSKVYYSYLLYGSYGTGKTTVARLIAKSINCINNNNINYINNNFPCNECKNCILVNENKFIDFIEIDAASKTKVEDIRDILDNIKYPSYYGFNKVYLIDEVHMLSKQSLSTLLKSLEEPPSNVFFILATTDLNKIPDTLISRCFKFFLKKISIKDIINKLILISKHEKININKESLFYIANLSNGSIRDSINLLEQIYILSNNNVNINNINLIIGNCDINISINIIKYILFNEFNKLSDQLYNLYLFNIDYNFLIDQLLIIIHYFFILSFNKNYIINDYIFLNKKNSIINICKKVSIKKIEIIYYYLIKIKKELSFYLNINLIFEFYILKLFRCINNNINN